MDDSLLMRGLQCFADLARDRKCLIDRNRTLRDAVCQRRPFNQLPDQSLHTARLLKPVDMRDVRMIQRGECLGFTLKSGYAFRVLRKCPGQHLDSDLASEIRVGSAIHLAHAAGADGGHNLVWSDTNSRYESHFFSAAVQFCTIVIGDLTASSASTFIRNRPSGATAYCPRARKPP